MISLDDILAEVRIHHPDADFDLIRKAYAFAVTAHDGQLRLSGNPYITHLLEVSLILARFKMDTAVIVSGLLHDVIEDTESTLDQISSEFGDGVASLVDSVTKIGRISFRTREERQAESFRKMLLAMARDLRVILIKLADRLHNMRTIKSMQVDKQAQKARETMDIFAPLAGRMGMQWMRDELEDLAFRVLNSEGRNSIIRRFITLQRETGDVIHKITNDIRHELEREGIEADVFGRAKKPYSIWRKMEEKALGFSRLSDIYGFRIITDSESDCYRVLGAIHQRWRAVPGRFKDYISQPKSNGYRSIHTTVSGRDGKRVEVQIRTRQMHDVAEAGVAAHWSYRDGVRTENPFAVDPAKWIASLTERFENAEDHDEFMEHVKLEMYSDQVFCFSPKGDVVKLPRGATPLDYAYSIHTRIGDSCVGAKVDGIRVPLWTRLKNGQSVEVITAEGQTPQSSWIDIVVTGRAKSAIRRSLRDEDRERFIKLGRELARVAFDHIGKRATEKALTTAAKQLSIGGPEELLARLGSAELSARDVVQALYPDLTTSGEEIDIDLAVVGLSPGQTFKRAACCQPTPGERIVGISYRGQGVVIHTIDCPALEEFDEQSQRWVDLRWHSGKHPAEHTVSFDITIRNDAGVLGRICTLIGEQKANISDLHFLDRTPDFYRLIIDVDLRDIEHLYAVMLTLEAESDVASIERYRDIGRKP